MKLLRFTAILALGLVVAAAGQSQARDLLINAGQARAQRCLIVAKSGAPFTSIQDALDSVSDASSSNRYLVMVGPGEYDEQVVMKPYVDIMGSGQGTTVITQPGQSSSTYGTVEGADNSSLGNLTVRNSGGSTYAIAIYLDGVDTSLRQVAVEVTAAGAANAYGIECLGTADPFISQSSIAVSGTSGVQRALYADSAEPTLSWCELTSDGGTYSYGIYLENSASLRAEDLIITASEGDEQTYGIYSDTSATYDLSRLTVTVSSDSSTSCYGMKADTSDGIIKRASFTVSGASSNLRALLTMDSDQELFHITADVEGTGSMMYGMTVGGTSTVRMEHFSFRVAGGTTGRYGINLGSTATLNLAHGTLRMPANENYDVQALRMITDSVLTADNVNVQAPASTGSGYVMGLRNTSTVSASLYNCEIEAGDNVFSLFQSSSSETTTTIAVNSRLVGAHGLVNQNYCESYLGSCLIEGGIYDDGDTGSVINCFECFDQSMTSACP
jgi:hypothetical protein